jgi:ribosomal protein L37AE/L43A
MTPTQLSVTQEQYESGSSATCSCGSCNYFLVDRLSVSYMWVCAACGEYNYHPLVENLRKTLNHERPQ